MSGSYVDQLHKLAFKDLEIPPRKPQIQDMPSFDEEMDPYSSDNFRMYEFKIRRCTRSRSHDWTDCPFAHPGEKARRRDPRRYRYCGTVCPEFRRGACSRGDSCEFSHGVFECWLHPSRYRTEACKDGKSCKRKVCFFAHTPSQLRSPSEEKNGADASRCGAGSGKGCCGSIVCSSVMSPTSTLFGLSLMSPPLSPPHSPHSPPVSPAKHSSHYENRLGLQFSSGVVSCTKMLNEAMRSLEEMQFNEVRNQWNVPSVAEEQYRFFNGGAGKCGDEKWNKFGGFVCSEPDVQWVDDLLM